MKTLLKNISAFTLIVLVISSFKVLAQEDTEPPMEEDKPVRSPWEAGMLIETQTDLVWPVNTLEMVIQHRFGKLNNEGFDLLGLYAPSNIRMGFNYGIFKNAQIGAGTTKNYKIQDVNWKYQFLRQTRSNRIPIALTYYGNVEFEALDESSYGQEYKFAHRVSYWNQLIVARKFSKRFTMQLSLNMAHYNQVDTALYPGIEHTNFGAGIAGRYRFAGSNSIIFEYDHPFTTPETTKPNLSIGVELSTSSHRFQLFVTTYQGISYQRNMVYNEHDFTKGDILLGFNITRNWSF
jgi:hypothetical protein